MVNSATSARDAWKYPPRGYRRESVSRRGPIALWALSAITLVGALLVSQLPFTSPKCHFIWIGAAPEGVLNAPPVPYLIQERERFFELNQVGYVHDFSDILSSSDRLSELSGRLAQIRRNKDDRFLIHVTAHGVSDSGVAYLLCSNFDPNTPQLGRVSIDGFLAQLAGLDESSTIVTLNTGHLIRDHMLGMPDVNQFTSYVQNALQDKSIHVVCASSNNQISHYSESLQTTVFGLCLVKGLLGAADLDEDLYVDSLELDRFLTHTVESWVRQVTRETAAQTPTVLDSQFAQRAPLQLVHLQNVPKKTRRLDVPSMLAQPLEVTRSTTHSGPPRGVLRRLTEQLVDTPKLEPNTSESGEGVVPPNEDDPEELLNQAMLRLWKHHDDIRILDRPRPFEQRYVSRYPHLSRELAAELTWHSERLRLGYEPAATALFDLMTRAAELEKSVSEEAVKSDEGSSQTGDLLRTLVSSLALARRLGRLTSQQEALYTKLLNISENETGDEYMSWRAQHPNWGPDFDQFCELNLLKEFVASKYDTLPWPIMRILLQAKLSREQIIARAEVVQPTDRFDRADDLLIAGKQLILDQVHTNWQNEAAEKLNLAVKAFGDISQSFGEAARLHLALEELAYSIPDLERFDGNIRRLTLTKPTQETNWRQLKTMVRAARRTNAWPTLTDLSQAVNNIEDVLNAMRSQETLDRLVTSIHGGPIDGRSLVSMREILKGAILSYGDRENVRITCTEIDLMELRRLNLPSKFELLQRDPRVSELRNPSLQETAIGKLEDDARTDLIWLDPREAWKFRTTSVTSEIYRKRRENLVRFALKRTQFLQSSSLSRMESAFLARSARNYRRLSDELDIAKPVPVKQINLDAVANFSVRSRVIDANRVEVSVSPPTVGVELNLAVTPPFRARETNQHGVWEVLRPANAATYDTNVILSAKPTEQFSDSAHGAIRLDSKITFPSLNLTFVDQDQLASPGSDRRTNLPLLPNWKNPIRLGISNSSNYPQTASLKLFVVADDFNLGVEQQQLARTIAELRPAASTSVEIEALGETPFELPAPAEAPEEGKAKETNEETNEISFDGQEIDQSLLAVLIDETTGFVSPRLVSFEVLHPRSFVTPKIQYDKVRQVATVAVGLNHAFQLPGFETTVSLRATGLPGGTSKGRLSTTLSAETPTGTLFLELPRTWQQRVTVFIDVDLHKQAFAYVIEAGGVDELAEERIRLTQPSEDGIYANDTQSIPIQIEAYKVPGFALEVRSTKKEGNVAERRFKGQVETTIRADFSSFAEGGEVTMSAEVKPHVWEFAADSWLNSKLTVASADGSPQDSLDIILDGSSPVIHLIEAAPHRMVTQGDELEIRIRANDDLSNVEVVQVSTDPLGFDAEAKVEPVDAVRQNESWVHSIDTKETAVGWHKLYFRARDKAGNDSTVSDLSVRILAPPKPKPPPTVFTLKGPVSFLDHPIPDATVSLVGVTDEEPPKAIEPRTVKTNADGEFELTNIRPGNYLIKAVGIYRNEVRKSVMKYTVKATKEEVQPLNLMLK